MKKTVKAVVSLILCCCLLMPSLAFAATEEDVTYNSDEEYVAEALAEATKSEVVGVVGKKVILYRESEKKKRIEL